MNKGFSLPIILIVSLFVLLPVGFFLLSQEKSEESVKGVSSYTKNGISIFINSPNGTWDLFEYLCETKEECTKSLTNGKRLETLSGGATASYEVVLEPGDTWGTYKYIKLYLKSGWGSQARYFKILDKGLVPDTLVEKIKDGDEEYEVAIIPTFPMKATFYSSVRFSD